MKENQNIEWKESWRDEYLKWISGFANAQGGVLIIGKNDQGIITGIANARKLLEELPNKVRDMLGILVDVNLHTEHDKEWLEIVVEAYPYPISYKGEYHYRSGSTKQELRGAALDKFLLQKQGKHWDGVPLPHVNVDDLNPRVFDDFKIKATLSKRISELTLKESYPLLIEKLHLKEGAYLKRAAILLFHADPEHWTVEHLRKKHPSQPFNPDIANVFFRAGLIEAWGRGIEEMQRACQAQQSPLPVFSNEFSGFWVEFPHKLVNQQITPETLGKTPTFLFPRWQRKSENQRVRLNGVLENCVKQVC